MRLQDYYCTVSEKKTCNYTIDSAINMTCEDKKWIFDTIKAIGKGSLSLRLRNGTKDQFQSVTQANKNPQMYLMQADNGAIFGGIYEGSLTYGYKSYPASYGRASVFSVTNRYISSTKSGSYGVKAANMIGGRKDFGTDFMQIAFT